MSYYGDDVDHAEHAAMGPCPDCGGPQADDVHAEDCPRELVELARRELVARLQTMTPAEVDTLYAPLGTRLAELYARVWQGYRDAEEAERKGGRFGAERATRYRAEADTVSEQLPAARAAVAPFLTEYERRGGWTRIYWCTANGGHAHSSTACRTLHITTGIRWLPDLSGTDEAKLVEMAGESACTVCYPTAPVAAAGPSQLRPAVEERERLAAVLVEREVKRAAKDAKALTMPDGSPVKTRWHEARTVVSGWREGAGALADLLWYGEDHPSAPEWHRFADMAAEALAHKLGRTVADVRAELDAKAAAKHKRDSRR